jgi:hypothetical protein
MMQQQQLLAERQRHSLSVCAPLPCMCIFLTGQLQSLSQARLRSFCLSASSNAPLFCCSFAATGLNAMVHCVSQIHNRLLPAAMHAGLMRRCRCLTRSFPALATAWASSQLGAVTAGPMQPCLHCSDLQQTQS